MHRTSSQHSLLNNSSFPTKLKYCLCHIFSYIIKIDLKLCLARYPDVWVEKNKWQNLAQLLRLVSSTQRLNWTRGKVDRPQAWEHDRSAFRCRLCLLLVCVLGQDIRLSGPHVSHVSSPVGLIGLHEDGVK